MSISPFEDDRDYEGQVSDPFRNGATSPAPASRAVAVVLPLIESGNPADCVVPGTLRIGDTPIDDVMPTWTNEDQETALARGWGVFETMESGPIIQRWDDLPIFLSDDDAARHVRSCQAASPLCRKAVLYLGVAQREWHDENRLAA
ncbi:hypothetical protein [Methylobacterium sp. AMS5]|uniref:hypothetical protein n=1 Tax=Methylobacterium sp. AMS5 TaxID=925818 RepID=UPI00074F9CD2|nr:hypothetical protein [Methylobacterium sp. AMS5]AMB48308.1 hypothetical protein Y590_25405 [Methylobacterium sp. AMS5]